MLRSVKDSDEDIESKTSFSIRRSSRIKQSTKLQKSPDFESDTNVSSYQPIRSTRQRIATMDSITTDILKERRIRKPSVSSEASEIINVEAITPSKRITRRSLVTTTPSTPTRANIRAASQCFVRAGSETNSPLPASRTTRRTRASSVDLETVFDQTKNLTCISTKLRKRASVLPLQSPVKEEIEEKQQKSGVKVDTILVEEFMSSGNYSSSEMVACSQGSQVVEEIENTTEYKVGEDNSHDEIVSTVPSDKISRQLENSEIHSKHIIATTLDMSFGKVHSSFVKNVTTDLGMSDEILIVDANSQNDKKDKSKVIEEEESLTEIENSPVDICKRSPTKELTVRLEDIFSTSVGGQKISPNNKENQTLNIINNTSVEKSLGPIITNVTSLNTKSSTTIFANKSLNEIEIKFPENEQNLGKRRRSRESTEIAVKHITIVKESATDNTEETDSFTDSLNPIVIQKNDMNNSSMDDTTKWQSLVHEIDKKLTTTNDTVELVSSLIDSGELVAEIIEDQICVNQKNNISDNNATEVASKLDKSITNMETYNKTINSQESLCSSTVNDNNEVKLKLEKLNVSESKNKLLNEPMKTSAESNPNHSSESIHFETYNDKSIVVGKLASINHCDTRDNLLSSIEQTKKILFNCVTESTLESSCTILEINPSSNDLNADNAMIQDIQSCDVIEVAKEPTENIPKKAESMNTSLKITVTSAERENKDILDMTIEKSSQKQGQENSENMEIDDDKSDVNISTSRNIPADKWKENAIRTGDIENDSNFHSANNESEAECDLILVDKQALLVNIDDEEEQEEQKQEEEGEIVKPTKKRKLSIKSKSASEDGKDSPTTYIDADSLSSVEKFVNKSEKVLNRNSSRPISGLNKSGQTAEQLGKISNKSDDEIRIDVYRLNTNLQVHKDTSLRESIEKRESLNSLFKDVPSRRSFQNTLSIFASKSDVDNSEKELDNTETHKERNLKKKRSLNKSEIHNKDVNIDEVESESKKSLSNEDNSKEDQQALICVENSDENKITPIKDLECKSSDMNYSTLPFTGSNSNNLSKSSDDTTNDSIKRCVRNFLKNSNIDDDDDDNDDNSVGSIDSDIRREYNLNAAVQEYSDENFVYDECRTSESESSDPDDNGSDLADFVVADNAIEESENEEEIKEQDDEDDRQEREEEKAAEQEGVEDKDIDDEQVKNVKEKNNSINAEKDKDGRSVGAKIYVSKNNASDKSFKVSKNKRKISTRYIASCQPKEKEDITPNKSYMKSVEEAIISDISGSPSLIKKKGKSYVEDETEKKSIKQLNESEINRRKLSKTTRTSMECSMPNITSKQEFVNVVQIAAMTLGVADEKSNNMSETMQRNKIKSGNGFMLKENLSFEEPKRVNNEEKILHTSLPSDLLERIIKTKPLSKTVELSKTMNVIHTEMSTTRNLRKEKLDKSAPELILRAETNQLHKKWLSKEEDNIVLKKTEKEDNENEVFNTVALFNDIQEPRQLKEPRQQKKRKRQAEETSNENITENVLSQDTVELDVSKLTKKKKKEKYENLSQILTVEDTCEVTRQFIEKKKKNNSVTKMNENVKKNNAQQENIRKKEKEKLHTEDKAQYSKKKKESKIITSIECNNIPPTENMIVKKKIKQQEIVDDKEILSKESLKKEKKEEEKQEKMKGENMSPPQTVASTFKSKSDKEIECKIFLSKTDESKNAAFIKARSEALEAIKSVTERIKLNKELKKRQKRKKEDTINIVQEQDVETLVNRNIIEKHVTKQKILPSSTGSLKRLSENVIDQLSDISKQVKKRNLLQNTEQGMPSLLTKSLKFLKPKVEKNHFISLSSSGATTQFTVIDLSKVNRQPSKTIASAISYRQRMMNRNKREPTSSYLIYLQKQHSVPKDGFSDNAF